MVFMLCVVREFFVKGVLDLKQTSVDVCETEGGKEAAFGLARIEVINGQLAFRMTTDISTKIQMTEHTALSHVVLNGKTVDEACIGPFGYGDVLKVRVGYEDPDLISQDTIVLVPETTPTTMLFQ